MRHALELILALLDDEDIEKRLSGLDGWERQGDAIVKRFDRGDFTGAVAFVDSLVEPANTANHHPDVAISWSEVTVTISTHSEGGLTAADFDLAMTVDGLA